MEKEKDSKLKQAMKGLDSFLTTRYSFRYNQITEQCEFHDKHKYDKYRVVQNINPIFLSAHYNKRKHHSRFCQDYSLRLNLMKRRNHASWQWCPGAG